MSSVSMPVQAGLLLGTLFGFIPFALLNSLRGNAVGVRGITDATPMQGSLQFARQIINVKCRFGESGMYEPQGE